MLKLYLHFSEDKRTLIISADGTASVLYEISKVNAKEDTAIAVQHYIRNFLKNIS